MEKEKVEGEEEEAATLDTAAYRVCSP